MKATVTQSEVMRSHLHSREPATPPPQNESEERLLVASLIIGNLIFWGSLFYLLMV
jgi:hypothetical protein